MATWSVPLPDTANSGDSGHIADHNALRASVLEIRSNVDAIPPGQQFLIDASPAQIAAAPNGTLFLTTI